MLQLTERLAQLELKKKAAKEAAEEAQTQYFKEGYTDALREAKKMGWDYHQIMLTPPDENPTLEGEPADDGDRASEGSDETHGSAS